MTGLSIGVLLYSCGHASILAIAPSMKYVLLYLITFLPLLALVGTYLLINFPFKNRIKDLEKFNKIFVIVLAASAGTALLVCMFKIPGAMVPSADGSGQGRYLDGYGCINLVGIPYGDRKFLNFLAWLGNAIFLPGIVITILGVFFKNKVTRLINKYITMPTLTIEALTIFNFVNALRGSLDINFVSIFICLEVAFGSALSVICFLKEDIKERPDNWKEIVYFIVFYLTVFICSLPVNTNATLFNTDVPLFGKLARMWRIVDFSFMHRVFIYIAIAIPVFVYFMNRYRDVNANKVLTLAVSIGVLSVFLTDYGIDSVFPVDAAGNIFISVNHLPIHLCHTALYVVPICIAFNFKRLFYFTYFINVFGAIMAMLWPNVGETTNMFAPSITLFWYNHIAAYCMPLLAVALGIFEKPKMKQMLWSLLFFGAYMLLIVFANAWLSNYVPGFDPNKIGTGTDYLFINGTYILDLLSDEAFHMLDNKLVFNIGKDVLIIYPLYQIIFFFGYVAIAFGMWFVYSLFFRIADAHKDLHNQLVIMRKEKITFKEKKEMQKVKEDTVNHQEAKLKFIDFSKRYGNSARLSADHVNLEVSGGEIFGFLGPNGAGKSTCIKTTIGIQPVTDGTIEVCGYDVRSQSVEAKKVIGYVPDHYALYEKLTGREYINYIADLYGVSKEDRDERISHYVDLFELNQAFDNRMQTYSHGMKQKMTIMSALIHNPKVWILDEPLTGLDPQSIYQVKEVMKAHAAKGNIVFFSSHIINVVEKLCTRIAIIKKGKIVYVNTMDNVEKEHPEGLEEFYMRTIRDNGDLDE